VFALASAMLKHIDLEKKSITRIWDDAESIHLSDKFQICEYNFLIFLFCDIRVHSMYQGVL
jgi:hypothetical protein